MSSSQLPEGHLVDPMIERNQGRHFFLFFEVTASETIGGGEENIPGGPMVKNLPANAGDTGSIPGQRTKISHAVGQLSPCAATTEPACLEPVLRKRSHCRKARALPPESSPCSPQLKESEA